MTAPANVSITPILVDPLSNQIEATFAAIIHALAPTRARCRRLARLSCYARANAFGVCEQGCATDFSCSFCCGALLTDGMI
jgi:hypothetical protein